jgi:hypothetical protein
MFCKELYIIECITCFKFMTPYLAQTVYLFCMISLYTTIISANKINWFEVYNWDEICSLPHSWLRKWKWFSKRRCTLLFWCMCNMGSTLPTQGLKEIQHQYDIATREPVRMLLWCEPCFDFRVREISRTWSTCRKDRSKCGASLRYGRCHRVYWK